MIRNIIVEGIDRIGKDTLISLINNNLGYQDIHSSKPERLEVFDYSLQKYQENYFSKWFSVIENNSGFIFNRFHLGEYVYSMLYRDYIPGIYLYNYESIPTIKDETLLILLYTDNFDIIKDDGKSFDFSKKEKEQNLFKSAFKNSLITNKIMVQVNFGSSFIPADNICYKVNEIMKNLNQ